MGGRMAWNAHIDRHRDTYGVEPICQVLQIAPSGYRRHAAEQHNPALRCARAQRDDALIPQVQRVRQRPGRDDQRAVQD